MKVAKQSQQSNTAAGVLLHPTEPLLLNARPIELCRVLPPALLRLQLRPPRGVVHLYPGRVSVHFGPASISMHLARCVVRRRRGVARWCSLGHTARVGFLVNLVLLAPLAEEEPDERPDHGSTGHPSDCYPGDGSRGQRCRAAVFWRRGVAWHRRAAVVCSRSCEHICNCRRRPRYLLKAAT